MANKIIAVDPGKFDIKAAYSSNTGVEKLSFRSMLYPLKPDEQFDVDKDSVYISYNGGRYILGTQGRDSDMTLKKDTVLHKVGLMAILSRIIQEGDSINLVLGCPASIYKDKSARMAYKDYLTDKGIISFDTGRNKFEVTFTNVLVMPESGGAPFCYPDVFENERVTVVDIGGLNMNLSTYNNGAMDFDSLQTINYGGYELERRINTRFSAKYGEALSQANVQDIIKHGGIVINGQLEPDSKALLESIYEDFISEIPNKIKSLGYNLSLTTAVFIGGTSSLLGDRLKAVVPHAIIKDDAKWANVLGFLKVGEMRFPG